MKQKILMTFTALSLFYGANAQYCAGGPTSTIDSNLESVVLNGEEETIDFTLTCPGLTGIQDQTDLLADLEAGSAYSVDVTYGTCGSEYSFVGSAWIDFDGDESFDEDELIGSIALEDGGVITETYDFTVPVDALNGITRMRVIQYESGSLPINPCAAFNWGSAVDFSILISGGFGCPRPFGLEFLELTATTVNFEWEASGSREWEYSLILGDEVLDVDDLTTIDVFPTTGVISDLTANTEYDFYLRSICGDEIGDTSLFLGPITFRTPCVIISGDDFCESFEPASETEDCWAVLNENADVDTWDLNYTSNPRTGAQSAAIYTDINGGNNNDWLISPQLNLDSPKFLSFWYRVQSAFEPNDFEVLLSTTGREPADFTEILMELGEYANITYIDTLIDLAAYADEDVYIAFHVPSGGLDGWRLYLDDICITNCPSLSDLTLNSITTTTAEFEWLAGGDETEWVIDFGPTGFTPGDGYPYGVATTTQTLSDLSPNSYYDIYVRSICPSGDSTLWVGPLTIHTNCEIFATPVFCEGFEDESTTEDCWSVIDANADGDMFDINYGSNARTGLQSAAIYTDFNGGSDDDWLVSPQLTLSGNEIMSYWSRVESSFEVNGFEILLSTSGKNPEDFTETLLDYADYANTEYELTEIDLSAYSGDVYIAFHVPTGSPDGWRLYFDDICFNICNPTPGTDGNVDVCRAEEVVNLNLVITPGEIFGEWTFPANPALITDGSTFNYTILPIGTYEVFYTVEGACSIDSTSAFITVYDAPLSGEGRTLTVCKNQPFDLLSGLTGTVQLDGNWTDPDGTVLDGSNITASNTPGTYIYTYTVSNGVCIDEEAEITVIIEECDYLSIANQLDASISIYPNPTNGMVSIAINGSDEIFNYTITDIAGKTIGQQTNSMTGNSIVTIDLTAYENGLYLVKLFNESTEQIFRIVKN